jgi:hypothetical protein
MCEFDLKQSRHLLASRRHRRSTLPRRPAPIQRLEEEAPPTPPPLEQTLEPEHRRTPPPPPLKTAQVAFLSPAFSPLFSPPQVSKSVPSRSLDHVGRIEPEFDAPWIKIEPPSHRPWYSHGVLLSPMPTE